MLVTMRYFDGPADVTIRMQFPLMVQAIDDINVVVGAMETSLSDLDGSLRLKLAAWEGMANGTYQASQTAWNTAATDIKNLLFEIRNAMQRSVERMQTAEDMNVNALARVTGRAG